MNGVVWHNHEVLRTGTTPPAIATFATVNGSKPYTHLWAHRQFKDSAAKARNIGITIDTATSGTGTFYRAQHEHIQSLCWIGIRIRGELAS